MTDTSQPSPLDPKWINLEVLQIWINQCTYGHDRCMHPLYVGDRPDLFIDVVDLRLVHSQDLSSDSRYFALSYVWGSAKTAELTKSTLESYTRPGVFATGNSDVFIPKTIRQSMQLVALLGERYLWVDRLCIVQDDETLLDRQIRIMASIYHQAHVTIVAAAGWDCDAGFSGIKGVSPPRHLAPNYGDDFGKYLNMSNFIWDSRGWTYQEQSFSRRLLIFADQIVTWKCATIDAHEGNISGAPGLADVWGIRPNFFSMRSFIPETVGLFLSSASGYNSRNLTHSSDGYRAFSGFLTALKELATEVNFMWRGDLWGLPVAEFDQALLWYPIETMMRRTSSLPSWSWVGWQGGLSSMTESWISCPLDDAASTWRLLEEQSTLPLCTWLFSPSVDHALADATKSVNEITRQSIRDVVNPSCFLQTRAQTGKFYISEPTVIRGGFKERIDAAMAYVLSPTPKREILGLLVFHDWNAYKEDHILELVAISETRGVIMLTGQNAPMKNVCNQINVIAVEWKDEVAYRVGIGRVHREHWELTKDLVFKDIKLG